MRKLPMFLLAAFFLVLLWSAIDNADYLTWCLEVAPGVLGVAILALTYKRFQFTNLAYVFVLLHCVILFIGAKYTYAEVPAFDWLRDYFNMSRNNYDKVGHFAQGFIPALVARELLLRLDIVRSRRWTNFIVVCVCLAISAFYELIEWAAAEIIGQDADAFLGTQGYAWDTQSDMLCALLGACCMIMLFSKLHDKAIAAMGGQGR